MMSTPASKPNVRVLKVPELTGAGSRHEFELHELALEWGLSEPIVIRDEDDIKARASWREKLDPFEHQVQNLITFCRRLPVSIIADDVGLGKTVSAGLILSELIARRKVNRCLVVCTKLIAPQWIEELQNKFGIDGKFATGSAVRTLFKGDATVIATSYDAVRDYMEEAKQAGFEMLILDEAHKLRNLYGANSAPRMAKVVRQALEARVFKYVLMLTATPMQNRIWDLYSLIDCLAVAKGHDNPFGSQGSFAAQYGNSFKQPGWSNSPAGQRFRTILRQYLVRARRATVRLAFPKRILKLEQVPATEYDKQLMKIIATGLDKLSGGKGLISSSLGSAMMSSPQALCKQLHNMGEKEPVWRTAAVEVDRIIENYLTPSKLDAVVRICNQLRNERSDNWRLVIFTGRTETLKLIVRQLSDMKIPVGTIQGGQGSRNQLAIQQYSSDPPIIHVIVSTDSGAEGVNLQAGNVLINYDLPWNPMELEQRIGRVQRLGSKFENVVIFNLAVKDSPEDKVVARLLYKLTEISESVGDIESILESADDIGGTGVSLETQIQQMVSASLRGHNVEEQRRLAEESIVNAKRQLEENEEELNQNLGDLNELHTNGTQPPELTQNIPTRSVLQFITEGLRSLGHRVTSDPDFGPEGLSIRYAGQRHDTPAALDRSIWKEMKKSNPFHPVQLLQPGQPPFEKLIQTWRSRAASHIVPLQDQTEVIARMVLENWLKQLPGATLGAVRISRRQSFFSGNVRSLVRASNGVDQYEKLVRTQFHEPGHESLINDARQLNTKAHNFVSLKSRPDVVRSVDAAVQIDEDLSKFEHFYNERLREELPKAGSSSMLKKKLTDDFSVTVEAEVVSAEGYEYEACDVRTLVQVNGSAPYEMQFSLIPAAGQILDEPAIWEHCEESDCEFPAEWMTKCDYSGSRTVDHALMRSEASKRKALQKHTKICERTGKTAIIDEFKSSSLSGISAISSELITSQISRRIYFPEELEVCDFTNVRIGVDELRKSEISTRLFRKDQSQRCRVSDVEGHVSEFELCEVTGNPIAPGEMGVSSVSGRRVAAHLLIPSERNPERKGLVTETVICAESGVRLLTDEAESCSFTQKLVDSTLLGKCEESGAVLLKNRMVQCAITTRIVSPDMITMCQVTNFNVLKRLCTTSPVSGRIALSAECETCEITGVLVLPGERVVSECSAKSFRSDERQTSEKSGRTGHCSEMVVCSISSKTLLEDEVTTSELSGKKADSALIVTCPVTDQRALPEELRPCDFTGIMLVPDALLTSEHSSKKFCKTKCGVSEVSGRIGHISEFTLCDVTQKRVLLSELVSCAVTGRLVIESECFKSAVSGRFALRTTAANCEITDSIVLPGELRCSEVSGKQFRADEAVASEKSGRIGHQSEAQKCDTSGKLLLLDEVSASAVSGKFADSDLIMRCFVTGIFALPAELQKSDFSTQMAVPDEMQVSDESGLQYCRNEGFVSAFSGKQGHVSEQTTCENTGTIVLKSELQQCVISGRRVIETEGVRSAVSNSFVLPEFVAKCEITDTVVLPSELICSEVSESMFRSDQAVRSEKTGRTAHSSECSRCVVSGKMLFQDELFTSAISGRLANVDLIAHCSVTGITAIADELRTCEFTGAMAIPCEMRLSNSSGQWFCSNQAFTSELSGNIGHCSETAQCRVTGKAALITELTRCAVSGQLAIPSECGESGISGRKAILTNLVQCELTRVKLLPVEVEISSISGKRFRHDEMFISRFTRRKCHKSEVVLCEYTGDCLLRDEAGVSDFSGKTTDTSELELSSVSRRRGRPEEFVICDVSQRKFLKDEVAKSVVSGLIVDRELMVQSGHSGRLALKNEMVVCSKTGRMLLPVETGYSSVSNRRVDLKLLRQSDFSSSLALEEEMLTCNVSGKRGVPADGVICSETGKWVAKQFSEICTVTGEPVREDLCVRSDISGRLMRPSKSRITVKRESRSPEVLHPDETLYCHWYDGYFRKTEVRICARTGLSFLESQLDDRNQLKRISPFMYRNSDIALQDGAQYVNAAASQNPDALKRLRRLIFMRRNAKSKILFFRGHVDSKWRFSVYYVFFAARITHAGLEIISPLTCETEDGGWKLFP